MLFSYHWSVRIEERCALTGLAYGPRASISPKLREDTQTGFLEIAGFRTAEGLRDVQTEALKVGENQE